MYDCKAECQGSLVVKSADATTMTGLTEINDKTNFLKQIESTVKRCNKNNLKFNVSKMKEIFVDF